MRKRVFLVGQPNVGKSSVFNQLTGIRQKTGNYSGVTVERKTGFLGKTQIIDLPGLKSVWSTSVDEQISVREIQQLDPEQDAVLFIADGVNLAQDLLLFSQVADLQIPILLVINYQDEVLKQQIQINVNELSKRTAVSVLMISARTNTGIQQLKTAIQSDQFKYPNSFIRGQYENQSSNDTFQNTFSENIEQYHQNLGNAKYLSIVKKDYDLRQPLVDHLVEQTVQLPKDEHVFTDKIDAVLLHPIWGTAVFLMLMLFIFQSIFSFSGVPMDWIDGFFGAASSWANETIQPAWLADIVGNAILPGLGGILIFIPQIAILFFLLGILESTGYMSRISYLSDRWLRRFGLSGSSVIPLLSGIACAIPAVMSARSITDERERLAAILVSPFMTCSARLPVYAVLIGLIFPEDAYLWIFNVKGLILLGLYLLGTITALLAAWAFTKWKSSTDTTLWMLDLPRYQMPNWSDIFKHAYLKTKAFVVGAGKIILAFSIVLWFIASFSPHTESFFQEEIAKQTEHSEASIRLEYSYAGYLGKTIEPVIRPLGYDWKIGIALISSFAAREVFVGTISTVYSIGSEEEMTIIERLQTEVNPETGKKRFNWATCISLLLFYAFAMQCMSTIAIVKKETGGWKWPIIQTTGMMVLAYVSALVAYQVLS